MLAHRTAHLKLVAKLAMHSTNTEMQVIILCVLLYDQNPLEIMTEDTTLL